jgi:hypothetical protein
LRFSHWWLWRVLSSWMWRHAVREKFSDVSEEHITSIFRVEEYATLAACILLFACLAYSSTLRLEEICSSEKSVNSYKTTRRQVPYFHSRRTYCFTSSTRPSHLEDGDCSTLKGWSSCDKNVNRSGRTKLLATFLIIFLFRPHMFRSRFYGSCFVFW